MISIPRFPSWWRVMLAALVLGACAPMAASAAELYTVAFMGTSESSVSSATPMTRDSVWWMPPSAGTGLATGHGHAGGGVVQATHRLDIVWNGGSGTYSSGSWAKCSTQDFLITGPASPASIATSLHLRLVSTHGLAGGYAGHSAHAAGLSVQALARQAYWPFGSYAQTFGTYSYSNWGSSPTGFLTGQAGPSLDVPFTLTGNFPVNIPFSVEIRLDVSGTAYGNFSTSPGLTECSAEIHLDHVDGQVMTLPVGYSLDSPAWSVVNNTHAVVGVHDAPGPARLGLRLVGANPFAGEARVALDLPRADAVRVRVFDLAGRVVRTLADGRLAAGRSQLVWDGRGANGALAPPGIYFVGAECGRERLATRLTRLR